MLAKLSHPRPELAVQEDAFSAPFGQQKVSLDISPCGFVGGGNTAKAELAGELPTEVDQEPASALSHVLLRWPVELPELEGWLRYHGFVYLYVCVYFW